MFSKSAALIKPPPHTTYVHPFSQKSGNFSNKKQTHHLKRNPIIMFVILFFLVYMCGIRFKLYDLCCVCIGLYFYWPILYQISIHNLIARYSYLSIIKKNDSHLMNVITQYMQYAISYFITSFTCWLVLCKYLEICWHRALKYTSNIFVGNSPTQQDHDAIAFM